MKAEIIEYSFRTNQAVIRFSEDFSGFFDKFRGKLVNLEIKLWRPRRSGAANRYLWVLVDKIAKETRQVKDDVYREAVKEIGGVSEVLRCKDEAVDRFCKQWATQGLGWQTEVIPLGDGTSDIIVYYGSSTFDTEQMTQLIDNMIFEARSLGIDTDTPDAQAYWESVEEEARKREREPNPKGL